MTHARRRRRRASRRRSRCRSIASGVVRATASLARRRRSRSTVPSSPVRRPAGLEERAHEERRRRLAVGAGDPDRAQLARSGRRRSARGGGRHRRAHVGDERPRARRGPSGRSTTSATAPRATASGGEVVAVAREARHAEEQRARASTRAVVVGERRDLDRGRVAATRRRSIALQQLIAAAATAYCGGMPQVRQGEARRSCRTPARRPSRRRSRPAARRPSTRDQQLRVQRRREADERGDVVGLRVLAGRRVDLVRRAGLARQLVAGDRDLAGGAARRERRPRASCAAAAAVVARDHALALRLAARACRRRGARRAACAGSPPLAIAE